MKTIIIAILTLIASTSFAQTSIQPSNEAYIIGGKLQTYLNEFYVVKDFKYLEAQVPKNIQPGEFGTCKCAGDPWASTGDHRNNYNDPKALEYSYEIRRESFEKNDNNPVFNVRLIIKKEEKTLSNEVILRASANLVRRPD